MNLLSDGIFKFSEADNQFIRLPKDLVLQMETDKGKEVRNMNAYVRVTGGRVENVCHNSLSDTTLRATSMPRTMIIRWKGPAPFGPIPDGVPCPLLATGFLDMLNHCPLRKAGRVLSLAALQCEIEASLFGAGCWG